MINHRTLFLICLAFLGVVEESQAQWWGLGLGGTSEFERQLDVFRWGYLSDYRFDDPEIATLDFRGSFNRRLIRANTSINKLDQSEVRLTLQKPLSSLLYLKSEVYRFYFSQSDIENQFLVGGIGIHLPRQLQVEATAGVLSDMRNSIKDEGEFFKSSAHLPYQNLGEDWKVQASATSEYADLSPRTQQTHRVLGTAEYSVEKFHLTTNVQWSLSQRDGYQPSSFLNRNVTDVIESVIADTTGIQLSLRAEMFEWSELQLDVSTMINVRRFENESLDTTTSNDLIDSRFVRQEVYSRVMSVNRIGNHEVQAGLTYQLSGSDARLLGVDQLDEITLTRRTELVQNTVFDQAQFGLVGNYHWKPTTSYSSRLSLQTGILRFDTPESNKDDRDEFSALFDLVQTWNPSSWFQGRLSFSGEAFHKVYLKAERSIENNWRRSLRVVPDFTWNPSDRFQSQTSFLLRANYTVFDFPSVDGTIRDQSSREWGVSHRSEIQLFDEFYIENDLSRNVLHIGQLFWGEFAETPIDTLITTNIEVRFSARPTPTTRFALGFRGFRKDDFIQATTISLEAETTENPTITRLTTGRQITLQWGPVVDIDWYYDQRNSVRVRGWLQFQDQKNRWYNRVEAPYTSSLTRLEKWNRIAIYPNIEIATRFYF